jgi:L-rhamnose isomerase
MITETRKTFHSLEMRTMMTLTLRNHQIELPSWAFGNSGTRFRVFGQPGVPREPFEKASDAAQVVVDTGHHAPGVNIEFT